MNFETTPGGTSRKREPHTILKTDERSLHQELGGDKFEVAVKNGRCVVTRPRPALEPAMHYCRMRSHPTRDIGNPSCSWTGH